MIPNAVSFVMLETKSSSKAERNGSALLCRLTQLSQNTWSESNNVLVSNSTPTRLESSAPVGSYIMLGGLPKRYPTEFPITSPR